MMLLVGLGNPGPQYAGNRHNIGFMAVDAIAAKHGFGPPKARFKALTAEGFIGGVRSLILKPMTFMNLSGESVGEAARYLKIPLENIIVFHDELDLAPGKLRMKQGGGHAGHNGLRSLDAHIGAGYRRARLGIGHPGDREKVLAWVLNDFAKTERTGWLEPLLKAIAEAAPILATRKDAAFASKVGLLTAPPPPPKPDRRPPETAKKEAGDGL